MRISFRHAVESEQPTVVSQANAPSKPDAKPSQKPVDFFVRSGPCLGVAVASICSSFVHFPQQKPGEAHHAASKGDVNEVRRFLEEALKNPGKAEDLFHRGGPGLLDPLSVAAKNGHAEVVDLMLRYWRQHEELRRHITQAYNGALAVAAEHGRTSVVKLMLESVKEEPELLPFMNRDANGPLVEAAQNNQYDVVSTILGFAEENPRLADWLLKNGAYALLKATNNFDDKMVGVLMSTTYWKRILDATKGYHPTVQNRIEKAVAPYVVDL